MIYILHKIRTSTGACEVAPLGETCKSLANIHTANPRDGLGIIK